MSERINTGGFCEPDFLNRPVQAFQESNTPLDGSGFCEPELPINFVPFNRSPMTEIVQDLTTSYDLVINELFPGNPSLELRRGRAVNIASKRRPV